MRVPSPRAALILTGSLAAAILPGRAVGRDVYSIMTPASASILSVPAVETVYMPTSYSFATPTSYSYTPTTYVSPTSYSDVLTTTSSYAYYAPTSYYTYRSRYVTPRRAARMGLYSTSYYSPSSYYSAAPTSYVRATPTAYYATSVPSPVVATTTCVEAPPMSIPTVAQGGETAAQFGKIVSTPAGVATPTAPPERPKEPMPEPPLIQKPTAEAAAPPTRGGELETPAPAASKPGDPIDPISPPSDPKPPAEPKASNDGTPGSNAPTKRYNVMKPAPGELVMAPPAAPPVLIRGKVTSATTGEGISRAKVILTSTRYERRREFVTAELGGFEIPFLPDGDWAIAVEDPKGKSQDYGQLTVSSGRVYDDSGRSWTSLNLNR